MQPGGQNPLQGLSLGQIIHQFVQVADLPQQRVLHRFYPHTAHGAPDAEAVRIGVGAWEKKSP